MDAWTLVRRSRARSGLSKRAFAERVGTSRMALDLIEKGERVPGLDLVNRIAAAGGLTVSAHDPDGQPLANDLDAEEASTGTLARHLTAIDVDDPVWTWRWLVHDFVANEFVPAGRTRRAGLLRPAPATTGDQRWDRFVHALAEHLTFHAALSPPQWLEPPPSDHGAFWWPVHGDLPSTRAAALAFSPASFACRGILIDGRELPRVRR